MGELSSQANRLSGYVPFVDELPLTLHALCKLQPAVSNFSNSAMGTGLLNRKP